MPGEVVTRARLVADEDRIAVRMPLRLPEPAARLRAENARLKQIIADAFDHTLNQPEENR
jgi:hypothetical protein